jgi:hypothetical protein
MKLSPHSFYRLLVFFSFLFVGCAYALEADFRFKWFTTSSQLPAHDVQREAVDSPSVNSTGDLRMMFRQDLGPIRFIVDYSLILQNGDAIALQNGQDSALDQTVISDRNRWINATWDVEDGAGFHHQSLHRLDRAAIQIQQGDWGVTLGRQAVSWGSGHVFQPMDPFNPFSPTVVDRDYKPGNDLLLVERLFDNGHDMQVLHIARRDADYHVTNDVSSTAFKWHGMMRESEFEVVAAHHYGGGMGGLTLRVPWGGAMIRSDVMASELRGGKWSVSGIVNADYSFMLGNFNSFVFGEYFYNDLGVNELPDRLSALPLELAVRLERGEVFNLMKHYMALGGNILWHPLFNTSLTLITNIKDSSSLMSFSASYIPSDHQTLQVGWIHPLGRAGNEYGGVPLLGKGVTTGGASRGFLRWLYYL